MTQSARQRIIAGNKLGVGKEFRQMKLKLAAYVSALLLAVGANAQTPTTNSYSQTINTAVLDDNPNGIFSTINVSGLYGTIAGISVTLDVANGYNGDLYGWLVNSNGGTFAVLLNRVGVQSGDAFGYGDSGFHVTFTDTATNDIHFYQKDSYTLDANGALTGTWAADGRNIDPGTNAAVLGSTASTAILSSFWGTNPNGEWTLFLADFSGGYQSTWQDWQLNLITVPEPASGELLAMFGVVAAMGLKRRSRK